MYLITRLLFFASVILPFLSLFPIHQKFKRRFIIFIIQIIIIGIWNIIFEGVTNGFLPRSFSVFGSGAPESSVFMINWIFEPVILIILMVELIYFLIYLLTKKKLKKLKKT
jgi:hypothetical protein